jgi:hypothetical protein
MLISCCAFKLCIPGAETFTGLDCLGNLNAEQLNSVSDFYCKIESKMKNPLSILSLLIAVGAIALSGLTFQQV